MDAGPEAVVDLVMSRGGPDFTGSEGMRRRAIFGAFEPISGLAAPEQYPALAVGHERVVNHFTREGGEVPRSSGRIVSSLVAREMDLRLDPFSGGAHPVLAHENIMPAIHAVVDERSRSESARGENSAEFNKRFATQVTHGYRAVGNGTADRYTLLLVRGTMSRLEGGVRPDRDAIAQAESLKPGDEYLTNASLEIIAASLEGIRDPRGLPDIRSGFDGQKAPADAHIVLRKILDHIAETKESTKEAADTARSLQIGFDQEATYVVDAAASIRESGDRQHREGFTSAITIANMITPILNERHGLTGEQELKALDMRELADVPAAYGRLLMVCDPRLLRRATVTRVSRGDIFRSSMVFMEAGYQRYVADRQQGQGLTIGDYVLRRTAEGADNVQIQAELDSVMTTDRQRQLADRRQGRQARRADRAVGGPAVDLVTHAPGMKLRIRYGHKTPGRGLLS